MSAPYKTSQCRTCGQLYDEAEGDAGEGLAPGTRWADIPKTCICPLRSTPKAEFDMVEL